MDAHRGEEIAEVAGDTRADNATPNQTLTRKDRLVVGCILLSALLERVTFFSIAPNLILFCTVTLGYSSGKASVLSFVFSGLSSVTPIFGGFVADAWTGKFKCIIGSSIAYTIGMILLPVSAFDYGKMNGSQRNISVDNRRCLFYIALIFIQTGLAGFRANIITFGAHQIRHLGQTALQSYCHWYYYFINVGAILAFTVGSFVQQHFGFGWGYVVPLGTIVLSLLCFVIPRSKYDSPGPEGSIVGTTIGICIKGVSVSKAPSYRSMQERRDTRAEDTLVDGIRCVIRLTPIFGFIVVYWAVYSQMYTSFIQQGLLMDLQVGGVNVPVSMLITFNPIIILLIIPIMDRIVYPWLERRGKSPSSLQKIGFGMILAACAMLCAGCMEMVRKHETHGYRSQVVMSRVYNASSLSVFAQVPQYAFVGLSEVFTSISGLEFAYTHGHSSLQSLTMGLFLFTQGLGSFLGLLMLVIVQSWRKGGTSAWYPADLNSGHLEYVMFVYVGLSMVNLLPFVAVSRWYRRKQLQAVVSSEAV